MRSHYTCPLKWGFIVFMPKRRHSNAGNVFLALFGAIAVAGVLGAALSVVMKGPLVSSVNLTRQNTAEAQMALAGRAVVMAAASLPNTGDCDGDGMVEPWEWRAGGGLPVPTGGGLIPDKLLTSNKDPWGTEYGYCAWDNGSVVLNAACRTGASDARLAGGNLKSVPTVAIISAGPDKKFTTTCRTFAAADVSGNGVLGDPTDLPMVSKAAVTDDDMIFFNTYDEAAGVSGGLWKLEQAGDCTGLGNARYTDAASGRCYYRVDTNLNWAAAQASCESNGAFLTVINNAAEQALISTNLAPGNAWIGASDRIAEGKWIWENDDLAGAQFWQGLSATDAGVATNGRYSNWRSYEPNNNATGDGEDCGAFMTGAAGAWGDYACTATIPYICEKKLRASSAASIKKDVEVTGDAKFTGTGLFSKIGTSTTATPANCSAFPNYYNDPISGHCYYVATSPLAWAAAKSACEANGDYLAAVTSESENTIIGTQLGLNSGNIVWIGGTDAGVEGEWRWTGGEVSNVQFWQGTSAGSAIGGQYSKWNTNKPTNSTSNNCLAYNATGMGWHDGSCTSAIRYVCEKNPTVTGNALEVTNGLKLATPTEMPNCNAANKGATRQNANANGLEICDGSAWKSIGGAAAPEARLYQSFDAGFSYTCAIKEDGTNWCWGANGAGQTGVGNTNDYFVPVQTTGPVRWLEVSGSMAGMTCGIGTDKQGYCWGDNDYGQFGDGTQIDSLTPKAIPGLENIVQISVGNIHGCAIKADKTAVCWGDNTNGAVGTNTPPSQAPYPVDAPGATWSQVSAGHYYSCGIKTDGTAWCWGINTNGKLGDNTTTQRSVPTAVSTTGVQTWSQISAGYNHTCGIKTDGTGWCWGNNGNGRLGDGTTTVSRVPKQFAVGTTWKQVSAGSDHTCGIKTDGSAWCWGYNQWGRLGDGTTTTRQSPTKVTGNLEPFVAISSSTEHSCAMKDTGQVYCWGFGYYGNLGQGTQNNSSTPITQSGNPIFRVPSAEDPNAVKYPLLAPNGSSSAPSYSFSSSTGSGIYYDGGVKLKSATKLDINSASQINLSGTTGNFRIASSGGLKIGNDTGTCVAGLKGTLRYIAADKKFEYCNGTAWVVFGGAATSGPQDCSGSGAASYNDTVSGHCYYKTNTNVSWNDAQASCQADGGYLAAISSEAEFDMIITNLALPGDGTAFYWLGGSDSAVEGQWRWTGGEVSGTQFWQGNETGSAVNGMYNAWMSGSEPSDADATSDCMFGGSYSAYGIQRFWMSTTCTFADPSLFAICEKGM